MAPAKGKRRKDAVSYSPGMGDTRCRNCEHYDGNHHCDRVSGFIDPDYWCRLFERRDR